MAKISRRNMVKSIGLTAGASLLGVSSLSQNINSKTPNKSKLKILVIGAHPDDPETICGGTMAVFANSGHEVVSAYLTRGEAGIEGISYTDAAKIRTEEALKACQILKSRPEFLGQIDGSCEITKERYIEMIEFIKKEKPNIVFTHWPIDTHRDHRICSSLVLDAWLNFDSSFALYYCEAMTGAQSQNFSPTDYVDISAVIKQKHDACFIHKSQKIEEEYAIYHGRMEIFRGMESNCQYAEAFIRHFQSSKNPFIL